MPSINAATISPPAGKRWREAPEGGHRESFGHTASVTDVRNPAIARWQTQFHDGTNRARCELCPRRCVLKPGQRGFCFVRSNHDGLIVSDTYGRSSGFAVDPVEKKPLNHFHPGSSVLSFGTAGCNSGCRFCQNWDIAKARSFERLGVEASPEKIAQVAADRGIDSVAFTYNDPIVFAEYAIDTAEACRALGIHPIAVTAGYMSAEARPDFYAAMDAANIDLKGFTEEFYSRPSTMRSTRHAHQKANTCGWSSPRYSSLDSTMTTPSCMLNVHGYASTWVRTCRCTSPHSTPVTA